MSAPPAPRTLAPGFTRALGLREAVAINMTQMCGIGPFVTIPLMVATVGGPQAILGWIVGALLAVAEYATKLHAVCAVCGAHASRSQRLVASEAQLFVGGAAAYEARCRGCFVPAVIER